MTDIVYIQPLTAASFAPFGDVIEASGHPHRLINAGMCRRFDDCAQLSFADGRAGISVFDAKVRKLPMTLDLMERHPDCSQAFLPMTQNPFLVVVASDEDGVPGRPVAFETQPGQGVNYHRNVWHGVLAPLHEPGLFAVVDRVGAGTNLEEHRFAHEITIMK